MRYGRRIKRYTIMVAIAVIVLTLITLRFSYSAFFSVESQSTIQQISTGVLDVVIDNTLSHAIDQSALYPVSESLLPTTETSPVDGGYATLTLSNQGNLMADFSITLGYDEIPENKTENDLISFNYLKVGIYDADKGVWVDFGENTYYTQVTSLTPSDTNLYPILRDTIEAASETPTRRQFRIYIWLAEETPVTEIGKLVYLKLDVKSMTVEGHE